MMFKVKSAKAFSLTEALITMFVVMIVVLAASPVVTKKQIKNKRPHGVWECKLNENMEHYTVLTMEGETPLKSNPSDHCEFAPQINAESYSITVIGGGGGGASGTTFSVDSASYGNSVGFKVPAGGEYDILVVGGGGGGSAKLGTNGNRGGGAGGVEIREKQNLKQGDYLVLEAGVGGEAGGTPEVSNVDQDSEEDGDSCTTGNWRDICNGKDGNPSRIYIFSTGSQIKANGGAGGKASGNASYGTPYKCSTQSPNGSTGGRIFSDGDCTAAQNFLKTSNIKAAKFGHGGDGSSTETGNPGYNGLVMLISSSYHAGGGGSRGSTAYMTLKKINNTINVYVGKGGAGAVNEDTNGEQGENSSFGHYITAKGGAGGTIKAFSATSKTGVLQGEKGGSSPYGGSLNGGTSSDEIHGLNKMDTNNGFAVAGDSTYGAGGGGGAARSRFNCSASNAYAGCWGQGGRGMPGYVRVEWN